MGAEHAIDDHLERPWRGETHGCFHEHGNKHDDEPPGVGADEVSDQREHLAGPYDRIGRPHQRLALPFAVNRCGSDNGITHRIRRHRNPWLNDRFITASLETVSLEAAEV